MFGYYPKKIVSLQCSIKEDTEYETESKYHDEGYL